MWADDLPHGKGVKSSLSGYKYDGDWDCDRRHGQVSEICYQYTMTS